MFPPAPCWIGSDRWLLWTLVAPFQPLPWWTGGFPSFPENQVPANPIFSRVPEQSASWSVQTGWGIARCLPQVPHKRMSCPFPSQECQTSFKAGLFVGLNSSQRAIKRIIECCPRCYELKCEPAVRQFKDVSLRRYCSLWLLVWLPWGSEDSAVKNASEKDSARPCRMFVSYKHKQNH